jgi:quinol-cytochrome oxidoreductase complex cytochrome b subunit
MNNNSSLTEKTLIVILITILIIVFVISLGKLDVGRTQLAPAEFKDDKEEAKRKHQRLSELLAKEEQLKIKLTKTFKRIYFIVRILFVLLWGGILFTLYKFGSISNLGDILNYSEAGILIWLVLNFLTFGTISNLQDFISLIRTQLENWIWGKYIHLDSQIENHRLELNKLETKIK